MGLQGADRYAGLPPGLIYIFRFCVAKGFGDGGLEGGSYSPICFVLKSIKQEETTTKKEQVQTSQTHTLASLNQSQHQTAIERTFTGTLDKGACLSTLGSCVPLLKQGRSAAPGPA